MIELRALVFLAGLLHFCQVPAMIMAPRMLGWEKELALLAPINRRIVQVMGGGIMLTVLGLGVVVMSSAGDIAAGGRAGTALAAFLSVFWIYRGLVQAVLYARIWPSDWLGRASHWGLVALFAFLSAVYGYVFVTGFRR